MSHQPDPRHESVWRVLLIGIMATLGAALLTGKAPAWLQALSYSTALLGAVGFRWFTVRWRKTWLVFLVTAGIFMIIGGNALVVLAVIILNPYLMRRQASLLLLKGKRRALAFLIGVPLLVFLLVRSSGVIWTGGRPEGMAGDVMVVAIWGLWFFWLSTILTLLFGMRLHFMRLRPKLFVAGVLVGVIPLILAMIFGLMMLYAGMGAARANRTRDVLDVWARAFSRGVTPEALTVEPLVWVESDDQAGPVWITELVEASRAFRRSIAEGQLREAQQGDREYILSTDEGFRVNISGEADSWLNTVIAAQDTAAWVGVDGAYWLVHLQDPAPGEARVDALMLDSHAMDELSRILRVDLQVRTFEQSSEGEERPEAEGAEVAGPSGIEGRPVLKGVYQPREEGAEETWWNQSRYFGGAWIPAPSLRGRSIREDYMMVTLKTDFLSLGREFISQNNEFNKVIIVILATLALLFMFMQLVAMVFSLRITGGIVDGVRILHKGTQRLARGDLDAHIEIPNEDEFGDLAASFNEMTLAVKQGREDALARERLQNEMETARQIQARLLPHAEPLLPGWEVTGLSIPSRQVGGDYFDFLHPGDGKLGVAIGDVSGKGMPAALLMSNLQASLKGQLMHPAPVSDVVRRMNDLLTESTDSHMFATFFYGEIDGLTGHFTSTNAGHNPPLLVRADGEMEWLDADGLILGMLGEQAYEQVEGDLNPGDILVLYTDGITEAGAPELEDSLDELPDDFEDVDDNEVMFGEERLAEVVVRNRERSAMGVREAILSAVTKFVDGGPQGDDITLVVVKRKEI